jgi:hypothetical protein
MIQVIHGAGQRSQMEDPMHGAFNFQRPRNVVFQELESRVIQQMLDIGAVPRDKIVNPQDFLALVNQAVAKVRSNEPGGTGDDIPHPFSPPRSHCIGE